MWLNRVIFCQSGNFSRLALGYRYATIDSMSRTTVTFTISLPPEMVTTLETVMKQEHRTRSELIREALRRYFAANATKTSI